MKKKIFDELKEFTYKAYINLLSYLQTRYSIISFNEISFTNNPYVILRHDIDASLKQALNMAKLENQFGIKSTYFVLLSHDLYNVLEKNNIKNLMKISQLGHDVGLHYDLESYDSYRREYSECLESEIMLLESIIKKEVKTISMHNPSIINKEDPFLFTHKFINAYNPKLYDLYVSDSCRAWYTDDLRKLLELGHNKVELVIHPFLWSENKVNRDSVLEKLFREIAMENLKRKKEWIELWNSHKKVIAYDKEINQ